MASILSTSCVNGEASSLCRIRSVIVLTPLFAQAAAQRASQGYASSYR